MPRSRAISKATRDRPSQFGRGATNPQIPPAHPAITRKKRVPRPASTGGPKSVSRSVGTRWINGRHGSRRVRIAFRGRTPCRSGTRRSLRNRSRRRRLPHRKRSRRHTYWRLRPNNRSRCKRTRRRRCTVHPAGSRSPSICTRRTDTRSWSPGCRLTGRSRPRSGRPSQRRKQEGRT